ncbi:hypothetical protein ABFS82_05G081100 [Erythranthe guttata]|uniref:PARP catalytic domain-containing protein n=1 Tax=Erythranthe guttata TaxID=4155 RepID=A0A022Q9X0_ERYGU|nr:PREDICTED: uncharacterized protein LOC105972127 [Erythranthe guttata]EYU24746.1 hypothetical protein MIMGU_mgv1a019540mg [Erythranthe guttata]|eukprot:XP_012852523.1 PREDICTED: uncharacterized protein LOC105972127 [Erythranthe guttata]
MARRWMKSLQCKSKALDDVVVDHNHSLLLLSHCKNRVQSLKDVVETTIPSKPKRPQTPPFKRPDSKKNEPDPHQLPTIRTRSSSAVSLFPSLTELPQGHPSRNVVEIIFHTSWGDKSFSGHVEMVFKIQNLTRTLTRFEEYRERVKSRWVISADTVDGVQDHARCVADGNEVMRFYCLGVTSSSGGAYEVGCGAWANYGGGKAGAAICTYSGSGVAHDKAGGGRGRGRWAMLVCRVIAGRVCEQLGFGSLVDNRVGYDSVSVENGTELHVFDSRALLPCFLIIYEL